MIASLYQSGSSSGAEDAVVTASRGIVVVGALIGHSGGPCPPVGHSGDPCPPMAHSGDPCPPVAHSGDPCPPVAHSGGRCPPASKRRSPAGRLDRGGRN